MIDEFAIISDIALSFIAFPSVAISALTILKGRQRTHNSCYFEAMGAVILLTVTLIICKVDLKLSIYSVQLPPQQHPPKQ